MNKIKKNILSLVISLIMITPLICIQTNVYAATSGTCGANLKWSYDGDETLTISGTGAMYDYSDGTAPWYSLKDDIYYIDIKSGVTSIGKYAFSGMTEIYEEDAVSMPSTVTTIKENAFYESDIQYLDLPNGTKVIEEDAFEDSSLIEVYISASVTTIEDGAFAGCNYLKEFSVSSSNTAFSASNDVLFNKSKTEIIKYPPNKTGSSYTVPSGVTTIGNQAFARCSKLTNITLPAGLKTIESSAFSNCSYLSKITIPSTVTAIESNVFNGCDDMTSVTFQNGVTMVGDSMFNKCTALTSISLPASITKIGQSAFSGCSGLTTVTLANGIKTIGFQAFINCKKLTSISLPNSVTTLDGKAFYGCKELTKITIGSGLSSIGDDVFWNCSALTTIDVNTSNQYYSSQNNILFDKNKTKVVLCPQGKSGTISIPSTVTAVVDEAFYNCKNITSISLPNTIKTIGNRSFYGCKIAKINIPTSLTTIGENAFENCEGITSITIPDSVTKIGSGAFCDCIYLSTITLGKGLSSIEAEVFSSCENLLSITIPSNIKTIGDDAFSYCENLSSITFNEGLQAISNDAFYRCFALNNVIIPYSVTTIGADAFDSCDNLTSVIVPPNATNIGDGAFDRYVTGLVIKGKSGSQAEIYAKANSITFSALATYTITYNANGGSGAPTTQTKLQGINISLSSAIPTRTDAQFKGWATSANSQTVTYQSNAQYSQNANITLYAVWSSEYPSKIIPSVENVDLFVGGNERVYITIEPDFAINKTITWSSENPNVATVNDGLITGVGVGTTSIIAKTANNKQAKITVTVVKATNDIDFTLSESYYSATNSNIQITIDGDKSLVKNIKWAYGSQNENYFASSGTSVDLSKLNTLVDKNGIYTFCLTDVDDNKILKIITVSRIVFGQAYFDNTTLETENIVHIPINFEQINDNIIVYMALYDNGKLIKLQKEICIPSENIGKSSYTSKPFKLSYPKPGYELKAFAWNENMMPFINGINLKAENSSKEQIFEGTIYDSEKIHTFTVPETREYIIKSYTDTEQTKIALEAYLFGENGEYESDTGKTNFEIRTTLTAGVSYELIITNGNYNANGNYIVVIK